MSQERHSLLDDILKAGNLNCDMPYYPHPIDNETNQTIDRTGENFFSEISKDVETIDGTLLEFGTTESRQADNNGNAARFKNTMGQVLGDGLFVPGTNPSNQGGIERPGVGGVCRECSIEAYEMYQHGQIDLKEAQRRSHFSTKSGSQCQGCRRRDICEQHCSSVNVDGQDMNLCPDCQKKLKDRKWDARALNVVFELLKEEEQQPRLLPSGQQEQTNEIK